MSDQTGEKTEQPTPRHLEEALKKGRIARSREVQTVFVLMAGLLALKFTGAETWRLMAKSLISTLSHLHDTPLSLNAMQGYAINGVLLFGQCVWPVLAATMLGGLLAGGIQTRFRATSDALAVDWERISPVQGFKRLFSRNAAVSTGIGIAKLAVVIALCFNVTKQVLQDPIFHSAVDVARIAGVHGRFCLSHHPPSRCRPGRLGGGGLRLPILANEPGTQNDQRRSSRTKPNTPRATLS